MSEQAQAFYEWRKKLSWDERKGLDGIPDDVMRYIWRSAAQAERERCVNIAITPIEVMGDSSFDVFRGWHGLDTGKIQSIVSAVQRKVAKAIQGGIT